METAKCLKAADSILSIFYSLFKIVICSSTFYGDDLFNYISICNFRRINEYCVTYFVICTIQLDGERVRGRGLLSHTCPFAAAAGWLLVTVLFSSCRLPERNWGRGSGRKPLKHRHLSISLALTIVFSHYSANYSLRITDIQSRAKVIREVSRWREKTNMPDISTATQSLHVLIYDNTTFSCENIFSGVF